MKACAWFLGTHLPNTDAMYAFHCRYCNGAWNCSCLLFPPKLAEGFSARAMFPDTPPSTKSLEASRLHGLLGCGYVRNSSLRLSSSLIRNGFMLPIVCHPNWRIRLTASRESICFGPGCLRFMQVRVQICSPFGRSCQQHRQLLANATTYFNLTFPCLCQAHPFSRSPHQAHHLSVFFLWKPFIKRVKQCVK